VYFGSVDRCFVTNINQLHKLLIFEFDEGMITHGHRETFTAYLRRCLGFSRRKQEDSFTMVDMLSLEIKFQLCGMFAILNTHPYEQVTL